MYIRLLLAGLFGALILVKCTSAAHGMATENRTVLHIEVYNTEGRHAYEAWLPYPTSYTCTAAGELLDLQEIERVVAQVKHIKIKGSSRECITAGAKI
jgi:hypothetical protein